MKNRDSTFIYFRKVFIKNAPIFYFLNEHKAVKKSEICFNLYNEVIK